VFTFVAGLSLLTGIVFGLMPAFRATRRPGERAGKQPGVSATSYGFQPSC
jgi:hypothetical protein